VGRKKRSADKDKKKNERKMEAQKEGLKKQSNWFKQEKTPRKNEEDSDRTQIYIDIY
jgi:hypothetical protein